MTRPIALVVLSVAALGGMLHAPAVVAAEPATRSVVIEAFVREGSEASLAARTYLDQLAARRPGLLLAYRDVEKSEAAAQRLNDIGRFFRIEKPRTPAIYMGRRLIEGFESERVTGRQIEDLLTVEVFVREGCPRCARGKAFLATLQPRYPAMKFVYRDIIQDAEGRRRWEDLCRQHGIQTPGIPTVHAFGKLTVGFDGPESTGATIESLFQSMTAPTPAAAPRRDSPGASPRKTGSSATPRRSGMRLRRAEDRRAAADEEKPRPSSSVATSDEPPAPLADSEPPAPMLDEPPPPSADPAPATGGANSLSANDSTAPNGAVTLPFFGRIQVKDVGLPLFTLAIGLVDGFNPCAMWVLLFLLSVLVNLKDRWKILAVAGTFVLVSGLVYFAFMAAWMNVFFLVGYLRWVQVALGLFAVLIGAVNVKDFFAFRKGISLSIPESAKPGIYERVRKIVSARNLTAAIVGAIVLAILVNVVELLCTAGLPAMYTNILAQQGFPRWKCYLYLGLYDLAYMFDDSLMLGAVVITLSRHKLQESEGRWLKLVSGLVILGLGVVMLVRPEWLV